MLTLDLQDFASAFERSGTLTMPVNGRPMAIPFSTRRYEEARKAFLAANPPPRRKPIKHKPVSPASEIGKTLKLSSAALLEVYAEDDPQHDREQAEWLAELGRTLAVACLDARVRDGERVYTDEEMLAFYRQHMTVQQAAEFVGKLSQLVTLEVQDAADFFGDDSDVPGASESLPSGDASP